MSARSVDSPEYCHDPVVAPEAMLAAARYVAEEYVSSARIGVEVSTGGLAIFRCRAGDGSEWQVIADRWGNVTDVRDGETLAEAMSRGGIDR